MQGTKEVIASTVFVPVANPGPVVSAYMRNCFGGTAAAPTAVPTTVGVGDWTVFVPQDLDPLHTSITARATTAAGLTRLVSVVLTRNNPVAGTTKVEIFLRTDAAALVDTADFVEVSLSRLPL